jgi:hypothetical protein
MLAFWHFLGMESKRKRGIKRKRKERGYYSSG